MYLGKENDGTVANSRRSLVQTLNPSLPFPSKKKNTVAPSPLYLAANYGMSKLFYHFLQNGGDPLVLNDIKESCIHAVTKFPMISHGEVDVSDTAFKAPSSLLQSHGNVSRICAVERGEIVEEIVEWIKREKDSGDLQTFLSSQDNEGNTGLHLAAWNGLIPCLEKLIIYGAIVAIPNFAFKYCVDMADDANFSNIATLLEVVFAFSTLPNYLSTPDHLKSNRNSGSISKQQKGRYFLDCSSVSAEGLNDFINQTVLITSKLLCESYSRSEVILWKYSWNLPRLKADSRANLEAVYLSARLLRKDGVLLGSSVNDSSF